MLSPNFGEQFVPSKLCVSDGAFLLVFRLSGACRQAQNLPETPHGPPQGPPRSPRSASEEPSRTPKTTTNSPLAFATPSTARPKPTKHHRHPQMQPDALHCPKPVSSDGRLSLNVSPRRFCFSLCSFCLLASASCMFPPYFGHAPCELCFLIILLFTCPLLDTGCHLVSTLFILHS